MLIFITLYARNNLIFLYKPLVVWMCKPKDVMLWLTIQNIIDLILLLFWLALLFLKNMETLYWEIYYSDSTIIAFSFLFKNSILSFVFTVDLNLKMQSCHHQNFVTIGKIRKVYNLGKNPFYISLRCSVDQTTNHYFVLISYLTWTRYFRCYRLSNKCRIPIQ